MPIGASSPNRGRQPAVNSTAIVRLEIVINAAAIHTSAEVVCGIDGGVNFMFWARQVAGAAAGASVQPQFLFEQSVLNVPVWEDLQAASVLAVPPGAATRVVLQQPARRFRLQITAPLGGAVTVRYHIAAWAV